LGHRLRLVLYDTFTRNPLLIRMVASPINATTNARRVPTPTAHRHISLTTDDHTPIHLLPLLKCLGMVRRQHDHDDGITPIYFSLFFIKPWHTIVPDLRTDYTQNFHHSPESRNRPQVSLADNDEMKLPDCVPSHCALAVTKSHPGRFHRMRPG
jgi:hypothetical protein